MVTAVVDGIKTNYIRQGTGPVLLMMAPRAFDSSLESWKRGKWHEMQAIESLSEHFTIVAYDRRESGESGGRLEVLDWRLFARQAKLLLEHLNIERSLLLGVCMGVSVANQFAAVYPEACAGLILVHPVGGHRWKKRMHLFFDRHLDFVHSQGLEALRQRAASGRSFMDDPECGPWSSVMGRDSAFAARLASSDLDDYIRIVGASRDGMFPDTFVSGPVAADLLRIDVPASIWPGDDSSHSTSSAQQLRELLPRMQYWDLHPTRQTPAAMLEKIVEFADAVQNDAVPPSPAIGSPPMPLRR